MYMETKPFYEIWGETLYEIYNGDVLDAYDRWPAPDCIISDGAYGVGGFYGDPRTPDGLGDWYRDHVAAWSRCAKPSTTLWFWNTEIGWATVHPVLAANGWEYVQAIHWDKGVGHIAGNVNSKTIRRFPVVNEICVFYQRALMVDTPEGVMPAKQWMRYEWKRSGLPLRKANEACGVKDAATRKYFAQDWLWYFPPAEAMEKLVAYANQYGDPAGRPYYSLDGKNPVTRDEWDRLRYKFNLEHGVTNVWQHPALRSQERIRNTVDSKSTAGVVSAHPNQKPLVFMKRIIEAVTQPGDVVWEPFGGLCSAVSVAVELDRRGFAAEMDERFYRLAVDRVEDHFAGLR
jgi:DNA modification methylase